MAAAETVVIPHRNLFKNKAEFISAIQQLLDEGLLTLTRGTAVEDDARYAIGWEPLDGKHPPQVEKRHAENMRKWMTIK
jgi:hypothetical protein